MGLPACSLDETIIEPARGPRDLAIERVETLGNAATESGSALALGCTDPMLVWIGPYDDANDKLGDFTLAPPGDCGTLTSCGWMVVIPNSSKQYAWQSFASPIELDLPAAMRTGTLNLRVELRDALGEPVQTDEGKRLFSEFNVELPTQDCP